MNDKLVASSRVNASGGAEDNPYWTKVQYPDQFRFW